MEKTTQIREVVETAVVNLRQAAEGNNILGKPIMSERGTIIPVSQVTLAFVAGGGEYGKKSETDRFAGATGGGATLTPIGFLVISSDGVKLLSVGEKSSIEKILDVAKDLFGKDD